MLCNIAPIPMQKLKERSSMYKAKTDRQNMETQDTHENKVRVDVYLASHQR